MASSRSRVLDAVAVSPDIVFGDVAGNLERLSEAFARTGDDVARLIVAPELATSGYVFTDRAEALPLAMSRDDERLRELGRGLGHRSVAVFGFAERDGDALFNTAMVLSRDGVIATYRKSHLWGAEKLVFDPGEKAGLVVATEVGRLAVAICYDNEFPEVPRALGLAGADILALPVNWPIVPRPAGERAPETIQAMAAARSSRLPTVIADRSGVERGVEWTGGTAVIDGEGWVVAEAHDGIAAATVVIEPGHKGLGPHNDLFADRRPDLYLGPAS
ncbi:MULTISPECIES: nitrilase-related carbon-nitrogen hydrolase [unclassified Microbacterium]|uniref:nitrilase-related carbon-nitrogen hydrolase n=1 Tax=unclassified Microbacterium TaxID=2609290 RepID=UPI000EA997B1|nr:MULTISPECIES: nitrilase-related carbon-nitrogen hydrolase [unclassified Microbacterium]MBT2485361.1 hydrolase [Microbacterium sp. ISL-108]RKN68168.1 carbon-nitrogen hydrolase [Microbacterium sp. CGR2]